MVAKAPGTQALDLCRFLDTDMGVPYFKSGVAMPSWIMVTAMSWYVVSMGVNCIPSSLRACKSMHQNMKLDLI